MVIRDHKVIVFVLERLGLDVDPLVLVLESMVECEEACSEEVGKMAKPVY